jgi:hypothetical protein
MALTTDTYLTKGIASRLNAKAPQHCMLWTKSDTNFISDAQDNPLPIKGFMCTGVGNIVVVFTEQDVTETVTLAVSVNVYYPFSIKMIKSTSTTATGLYVFW